MFRLYICHLQAHIETYYEIQCQINSQYHPKEHHQEVETCGFLTDYFYKLVF
jgi:hypothetical protein